MASGFDEIYDCEGYISKVRAHFGRNKEVCMNAFNGKTYVHISDKSKCFVNGKFDKTKSKNITLSYEEAIQLQNLVVTGKCYDTAFHHYGVAPMLEGVTPQQMPVETPQQIPVGTAQQIPVGTAQSMHGQKRPLENWRGNANNLIAIPFQPRGHAWMGEVASTSTATSNDATPLKKRTLKIEPQDDIWED